MSTFEALKNRKKEIVAVAAKYGAANVRVFGSVARGEDTASSDVDMLVDMAEGSSLYDLVGFQQEVERLLGRKTEVLTEAGISEHLRQGILKEALPL